MSTVNPFLSRRHALAALGCAAAGVSAPLRWALAGQAGTALENKRLVLFALHGGNDGLNTLVPYRDPLYAHLRPTLGLASAALLPLSDELALNPNLPTLMNMFQAGEVAILQDVGCPRPNLSHFEAAAIWDSASPEQGTAATTGWWGEVVMHNQSQVKAAHFDAAAVTFDRNVGFAAGRDVPTFLVNQDVVTSLNTATATRSHASEHAPATARTIAAMINEGVDMRARFAKRLHGIAQPEWLPYEEPFAVQTKLTEWFLQHGVRTPLLRICQDGFDTHSQLLARHEVLMKGVDAGLADLKKALQGAGLWDDTVIMVHSEFGRRPKENGYGGTDHGTSAPVFLIGGKVQGGVYGARAALDDLDADGNLKFSTDFRRVYATLVANLWQLPVNPFAAQGFAPMPVSLA